MRYISLFTALITAFCITSCSDQTITPKYVYPHRYDATSCEDLNIERLKLIAKINKLRIANDKERAHGVSDIYYTVGNQISESQGEYKAILTAMKNKQCKIN